MAVKELTQDESLSFQGQRIYAVTNLGQGDTSRQIQLAGPVHALRVFSYGTAYTVNILTSPTGQANKLQQVGQVTNTAPGTVLIGPLGSTLRIDAASATGTVDVFIVVLLEM
jgi:hypothetical protein